MQAYEIEDRARREKQSWHENRHRENINKYLNAKKAIQELSNATVTSVGGQYMPYISNLRDPRQIILRLKGVITPLDRQDAETAERRFEDIAYQTGMRD